MPPFPKKRFLHLRPFPLLVAGALDSLDELPTATDGVVAALYVRDLEG